MGYLFHFSISVHNLHKEDYLDEKQYFYLLSGTVCMKSGSLEIASV